MTLSLTGIIDPAWLEPDPIENGAAVNPGVTRDPVLPNNEDDVTVTPGEETVIDIFKNRVVQVDGQWVPAASLDPVPPFTPGDTVTFRIDVENEGPAVARDVQVIDAVPPGLSNPVVADLSGTWAGTVDTCEAGIETLTGYPPVECLTASLGEPLLVDQIRSFLATFDSDPALDHDTVIENWAQARATNVPEDERPTDTDSTTGKPGADLTIAKTALQTRVLAGEAVDYQLVVTNKGPSISRGPIAVTDQLPVGLSYVPGSAIITWEDGTELQIDPEISPSRGSERLSWTPVRVDESLAPGETVVIELQTQLAEGVFSLDGLVNTAKVKGPDDFDPTNNSSDATVLVDPLVTLITEKVAVGKFQVGKPGTYKITVSNTGPTADPGPITVTDKLPAGLTYRESPNLPAGATIDASRNKVVWTLPDGLEVGEKATFTVVVDVHQRAYPKVTNTVTVASVAEKTSETILTADVTITVASSDVLAITGDDLLALWLVLALLLLLAGAGLMLHRLRKQQTVTSTSV